MTTEDDMTNISQEHLETQDITPTTPQTPDSPSFLTIGVIA